MNLQQRIERLSSWLQSVGNESVLDRFEELQQELARVIGSQPDGSALSKIALLEDLRKSEEDIKNDRLHTQEEVKEFFRKKAGNG